MCSIILLLVCSYVLADTPSVPVTFALPWLLLTFPMSKYSQSLGNVQFFRTSQVHAALALDAV